MSYRYDECEWPVVQFSCVGRPSHIEVDNYFRDSDALVQGERVYACLLNGLEMLAPDVEFVRRQALWVRRNSAAMRRVNRGIAIVVDSPMLRGMLRAFLHLQLLPVPSKTFSDLAEGLAWAHAIAAAEPSPRSTK